MNKTIKYVAIYLRKSREDTESREETLARHERILKDFCIRNNLIIKEIYKEVVSGENLDDRPVARKMLSDVECGVCGSTMQKTNEFFKCMKSCGNVLSYFDVVEKKVIDEIKNELSNFNYFIENYGQEMELKKKNQEQELELLTKELFKRDNMLNKACEMLEIGIYTKEKYLDRVNILEHEKTEILANMQRIKASNIDDSIRIKKAIPILEKVLDEYWNLSAKDKNDLLKTIIDKIEYTKTTRNNRWHKNIDDLSLKIFLKI